MGSLTPALNQCMSDVKGTTPLETHLVILITSHYMEDMRFVQQRALTDSGHVCMYYKS